MKKKIQKTLLRGGISVLLMAAILWKIDLEGLRATFMAVQPGVFALATALFLLQQAIIAYSWQMLLDAQKSNVPFATVLKVHFMGTFFGVFMPTSIGMDIVRAFSLSRYMKKGMDAATSMFISRVVGYIVFFAIALLVAVPVAYQTGNPLLFWLVLGLFFGFMVAVWMVMSERVLGWFRPLLLKFRLSGVADKIGQFQKGAQFLHQNRTLMLKLLAVSVLFQVLGIYVIYLVGRSLHIDIGLTYYFIYVPLIMAITILPLSIAGIGIREGSFVFFFTPLGATEEQALSLSLLLFAQMIFVALIGGVLYLLGDFAPKTETAEETVPAVSEAPSVKR